METEQRTLARRMAPTSAGGIAHVDVGEGPPALFVHGVFLHADFWRGVIERLSDVRRCIAPDLLAHGWTEESSSADLSFAGQARMLVELLDALDLEQVDLVGNDSGGGIAQILAARHPGRIRTLTLTNCDTHDGWPPPAFQPTVAMVTGDDGRELIRALAADPAAARSALAVGFEYPDRLDDTTIVDFLTPLNRSEKRLDALIGMFRAFDSADTVAVESRLASLDVPAMVVWGGADQFFELRWAHWLRDTLPRVDRVVEIPTGKLFLPFDRPDELAAELRQFWQRHTD